MRARANLYIQNYNFDHHSFGCVEFTILVEVHIDSLILSSKIFICSTHLYLSSSALSFVHLNSQGPTLCFSSQLGVQQLHADSLKSAMVGIFYAMEINKCCVSGLFIFTSFTCFRVDNYTECMFSDNYLRRKDNFVIICTRDLYFDKLE